MKNVLAVLDRLGRDAGSMRADSAALAEALDGSTIDQEALAALIGGDAAGLKALLGAPTNVVCGLFPGKEEEESPDKEVPEDEPAKERDPGTSIRRAVA